LFVLSIVLGADVLTVPVTLGSTIGQFNLPIIELPVLGLLIETAACFFHPDFDRISLIFLNKPVLSKRKQTLTPDISRNSLLHPTCNHVNGRVQKYLCDHFIALNNILTYI